MKLPVSALAAGAVPRKPHLVLHFDINETILVGDEAGGDSRQDCFNKMLAKSAFVRMLPGMSINDLESTEQYVPTLWWNGSPISETYRDNNHDDEQQDNTTTRPPPPPPPPLHTDWEWLEGCCPYYRTAYKTLSKNFVEHHGSIYRSIYDQLQTAFPEKGSQGHDNDDIFSHILPAFFYTLRNLPNDGTTTTIVLRTFGWDLTDIATAVSAFARGEHPEHSDFRNDALVLSPDALVQGRWAAPSREDRNSNSVKDDESHGPDMVYQLWKDDQLVASGDAEILQFLHSHTICGIEDHYEHWRDNNYEPWAGKPVWVPRDPLFHHILLDDNM